MKVPLKHPSEYEEQKALVEVLEILKNQGEVLAFTAIPNSTYTTSQLQKYKNYMSGLRRGFPDIVVVKPGELVCIELKKVKGGRPTPEQLEWVKILDSLPGVRAKVCYGLGEAMEFLKI